VLVSGAGAAARNSIGLVLVGGMTVGTLFTLLVIPSIYMLIARQHSRESAAAEQSDTACSVPELKGLRMPEACRWTADDQCRWSVQCNEERDAEVLKLKAG
jgi:hypothetical protein